MKRFIRKIVLMLTRIPVAIRIALILYSGFMSAERTKLGGAKPELPSLVKKARTLDFWKLSYGTKTKKIDNKEQKKT